MYRKFAKFQQFMEVADAQQVRHTTNGAAASVVEDERAEDAT